MGLWPSWACGARVWVGLERTFQLNALANQTHLGGDSNPANGCWQTSMGYGGPIGAIGTVDS